MKRVLLGVDNEPGRARATAESVADLPGVPDEVEVVILSVFEEFTVADEGGQVRSEELYDPESFPESVNVARDVLVGAGIDGIELRREHGNPAEEILRVADDIDADLIALGTRKRSPTGKVLFGSVVQSVLLDADRSVLVNSGD